ncbi:MAG: type I-MYXAN CRISPR-associated protein Cas6/Cmx6 [Gammaproteobacteria bacterium]|nr:type I-MYXAN CRISPR-associated protein Cas6/Cmx6 [Gammaproteobacteria bacterium]MBU1775370.1 type I-MYXAN CRISPR-associated protein Cas6/Cmx6 [Gammaproteobacteria bacterium]MBU1969944.1 type I-MYXAN CRISPR-associated protein Cas6/Cmx6 [Gammaproteobacteria bacterium]
MNRPAVEMIDLVFDLRGEKLPVGYPFALWAELVRLVPQLADKENVGVLPLKGSENKDLILLNKRAKLILRLPVSLTDEAARLAGTQLEILKNPLSVGDMKLRELQPYPTLHAQLAAGGEDEAEFMESVLAHFSALEISANTICGIRRTLSDDMQSISGFSLVVHDLKPDDSIRLQCAGMGTGRQFGCGIFVPYKVITDLE